MRIALVLACWTASSAVAQDALEIESCAMDDLEAAIALELGALEPERAVRVECADEIATITIAEAGVRVERRVELAAIAPHLRARTIALVAGELATAARRIVEPPPEPETQPEPPPEPPIEHAAPTPGPSSVEPAPPSRLWDLSVLAGFRAHPLGAPTFLGHLEIGVRYDWFALGVRAAGTRAGSSLADVDVFAAVAIIGVIPAVYREQRLEAGFGLFVEGGAVYTNATSKVDGSVGTEGTAALVGGFARVWGGLELADRIDLRASIDVGYDYGVEVFALETQIANVHSLLVAAQIGVSWAPP